MQLLSEEKGVRYSQDWLLEIAFHGSLALLDSSGFYANFIRIEEALHRLERRGGLSRSSQYVKGLLAYARDDLTMAERAFNTLPSLLDTPLLSYQAGVSAFRAPGFRRILANYDPHIRLNFVKEPVGQSDSTVLLLCSTDELYFAAFADQFAAQVFEVAPAAHVHFHLINGTRGSLSLSQADICADDRVSVTIEHTDLPEPGRYATMARYIILPLLLERGRPVLVTDIDLIVRNDPARIEIKDPVTLAFSRIPAATYIPASTIQASHALFLPSEAGVEFAQLLSRYLHYMCTNQRAFWGVDQVALLVVWRMLKNLMSTGDFRDLPSYGYGPPPDRLERKQVAEERLRVRSTNFLSE